MVDVIIPAYNAHDTIDKTLASIACQDCLDLINVYIVDDCSDNDYSNFIEFYSSFFSIYELSNPINGGPAVARQFGIDNSNGKYLIFIDADDVFSDSHVISRLFNILEKEKTDIALSGFSEERSNYFLYHSAGFIWMHGKMYRRSFLEDNFIKFNDTRASEDCAFNQLCHFCNASYSEFFTPSYIWRNNTNSITRIDSCSFTKKYMDIYVKNMLWAVEEALLRKYSKIRLNESIYAILVSIYHYYLQYKSVFDEKNIYESAGKLLKYFDESLISDDMKLNIIKNQLLFKNDENLMLNVYNPEITFSDFLLLLNS